MALSEEDRKDRLRKAQEKYRASEKYKITRRARERQPEAKEKKRVYDNSPEVVARRRARNQTPERKAAERARWKDPARRAYLDALRDGEKYKTARKEYERRPLRVLDRRERSKARLTTLYKQRCECCSSKEITAYYKAAKAQGFQIDHIQPIKAGGLHCLKNFQMLTKEQHRIKTKADFKLIAAFRRRAI
jgi:hypothetical protein